MKTNNEGIKRQSMIVKIVINDKTWFKNQFVEDRNDALYYKF